MDLPLHEDDLDEPGLIDALRLHRRGQVAPVAVLCFFNELLNELANEGVLTPVYHLRSEIGHNPVYEMDVPGGSVAVVHPGVGAPLAAAVVEEMRGLGVRTFVACGGAGALRDELTFGHVMVVESALREENEDDIDIGLFGKDETGPMPAAQAPTEKIPTRRAELPPSQG